MKHPMVSVLIPTYKKAYFLGEAIESVLSQTFSDFELIIVDDCSNDNTREIVSKYLYDKRIFFYENEKNLGIGGNWNKTLSLSSGKYIKFLMADDKFESSLLEKYVDVMEKNDEISLVTSFRGLFGDIKDIIKQPITGLVDGPTAIDLFLKYGNWIGEPTTVMFRRDNIWVGLFKTEYKFFLDIDMWIRQLATGSIYIIPEVLSWFRQHKGQVTKEVKTNFDDILEEYHLLKTICLSHKFYNINKDYMNKIIKKRFLRNYRNIYPILKNGKVKLALEILKIANFEGILLPFTFKSILSLLKNIIKNGG